MGSITAGYASGKEAVAAQFDREFAGFAPENMGLNALDKNRPAFLKADLVMTASSQGGSSFEQCKRKRKSIPRNLDPCIVWYYMGLSGGPWG